MEELDLNELFSVIWRGKKWIIISVIICIILGIGYSYYFVKPKYESSTTLVLAKSDENSTNEIKVGITQTDLNINQNLVSTYSELIKSKSILRKVLNNLNITDLNEDDLKDCISVSSVKDTELIEITVNKGNNAQRVADIANEIANVFTKQVSEIYNINNVHIVDSAEVEQEPYNINHKRDIAIFALIGVVLSSLIIILVNFLDNTIKTQNDIEKTTGLVLLAEIPEISFELKSGGKKQ